MTPINFWALNANSSKMAKDTKFKLYRHVGMDSPDITLTKVSRKWAWPGSGSCDPVIFWALNANSSKRATDTNFKLCRRVPRDRPDMFVTNVSEKWA